MHPAPSKSTQVPEEIYGKGDPPFLELPLIHNLIRWIVKRIMEREHPFEANPNID